MRTTGSGTNGTAGRFQNDVVVLDMESVRSEADERIMGELMDQSEEMDMGLGYLNDTKIVLPPERLTSRKSEVRTSSKIVHQSQRVGSTGHAEADPILQPNLDDHAEHLLKMQKRRDKLMGKVVPVALLPIATSNGMLVIGAGLKTDGSDPDCFFDLPRYLVIGGAVSLSMVVLAVVVKHVMDWVLADPKMTPAGVQVARFLDGLSKFMALVQIGVLGAISAVLLPNVMEVSYDKTSDKYCNYGAVVFSSVLMAICWFFILFLIVSYIYIHVPKDYHDESTNHSSKKKEASNTIHFKKPKLVKKVNKEDLSEDKPRK